MKQNAVTTYTNPVPFSDDKRHTNADPFIMTYCGKYYCYASGGRGVHLSVSSDLVNWEALGYAIEEEEYHDYWAPSVIYLNGIFYMYYSSTLLPEMDCHQEHLKLAVSTCPEGPFLFKKEFFDKFSIDSHPILWNGELYLFYSVNDWVGTDDKAAGTCILLDKMNTPEEFSGNPGPVILPSLKQEIFQENRFGDGRDWYTIEGACSLVRGDRCYLMYSANAYVNVDYFVGTAVAKVQEQLKEMDWEKYPDSHTWLPLLKKSEEVEGTGHNTTAKAPNGVDEWIVYHGRNAREELIQGTEQRNMRIDPLYFDGDRLMCFGPSDSEREAPQKPETAVWEQKIQQSLMLADAPLYYYMECWLSAERKHTGMKAGIYISFEDEENYLELQISSGKGLIEVWRCQKGICVLEASKELPKAWNYAVPHKISVERCFSQYDIWLDEGRPLVITGQLCANDEQPSRTVNRIGIKPYFTELTLHYFALTESVVLRQNRLQELTRFYKVPSSAAGKKGLVFPGMEVFLEKIETADNSYTEEFLFEGLREDCEVVFKRTGDKALTMAGRKGRFSVTHIVRGEREWFVTGGTMSGEREIRSGKAGFSMTATNLIEYRYVKQASVG